MPAVIVKTVFSAKKYSGLQFNRRRMQRLSSDRGKVKVKKSCRSKRRVDRLS